MSLEQELEQINVTLKRIANALNAVAAPIESEIIRPDLVLPDPLTAQPAFDNTLVPEPAKPEPVVVTTGSIKAENAAKRKGSPERAAVTARATELGIKWTTKTGTDALKKKIEKVEADANVVSHAGGPVAEPEPVAPVGDLDFGNQGLAPVADPNAILSKEQTAKAIELMRLFMAKYTEIKDAPTAESYGLKVVQNFGVTKISQIKASDFDKYVAVMTKNGITV